MSNTTSDAETVEIALQGREIKGKEAMLPRLLQDVTRAAGGAPDPFVSDQVVAVEAVYDLSQAARGEGAEATASPPGNRLLALEATDGTTLFIRADKLRDDLERLYPDALKADGSLDLSVLRDRDAASRGVADWVWSKLSVLVLKPDAIVDKAKDKAREWVLEKLGEQFKDKLEELSGFSVSTLGAKALMWAIESRLAGEPGLYRWHGGTLASSDRVREDDPDLAAAVRTGPLLVFIHGTGSHTVGSFGALRAPGAGVDWAPIDKQFGNRVFGFEHRTFSESPIDNALALAQVLPKGARLALVTHSRGGLVGDLLSLGGLDDELIGAYQAAASSGEEDAARIALWEKVAAEEQDKLRSLRDLLAAKDLRIERYLRVACPARGTTLLSDNLDVFLSGLLSLMSSAVGAVAGPGASPVLSAFKRVVLEIADKRLDPRLVPGIEAMLTDAPMGELLARAPRKQGVEMAVIAGDVEGESLLKRLGLLFTDWMFFDQRDNDLVVDTGSMYAGLAQSPGARYLFDQGTAVNHFSYFDNRRTREALRDWLTVDAPAELTAFSPLEVGREPAALEARERARQRAVRGALAKPDTRPVVVVLPGIMGSHLERRRSNQKPGAGNRVWFDPPHLMRGGLGEIRFGEPNVREESLFQMFYGDLIEHLEATHTVIPFPYDWRLPIQDTADRLADTVRAALEAHPSQPLRLLAHSMGGLVARAMIAKHGEVWQDIVNRPGGRFIMLGTPNNGSHLMVESLLGKSDTIRKLARIDLAHSMQRMVDIVAGFPGAVQLLPRPGFQDSGGSQADDYLVPGTWDDYRKENQDRWFGDGIVGVPPDKACDAARALWSDVLGEKTQDGSGWRHKPITPVERVGYVFGQADKTACGVKVEGGRLKMIGTSEGDGSVSWACGRLDFLPEERCWYMPAEHGSLGDTEEYFPAIVDLLHTGETARLGRLPVSRGVSATRTYDAGPVPYPTEEELARSLMSSRPHRRRAVGARQQLSVGVHAMDLRNAQLPVMCGHYLGDPIAGAEAQIDEHLVEGALRQRERLGVYAGEIGTAAVVLMSRSEEEAQRDTRKGAVIVGLGEMGELTVSKVTETVRAGVLRFLLHTHDRDSDRSRPQSEQAAVTEGPAIGLASLLIGYNSTTLGSVENFVDAIVLGVCEANRQFADAMRLNVCVSKLEFIELFLDTAITAAHAVRGLGKRLASDLQRLEVEVVPDDRLKEGVGVQQRLFVSDAFGYWPRLIVTDADRGEETCPPECYQMHRTSPIPEEVLRELLERECPKVETSGSPDAQDDAVGGNGMAKPSPAHRRASSPAIAGRLKYVFLSARARAEAVVQQRQPGLVEALVKQAIRHDRYSADLARTLFQLMVPLEFKATARDMVRLHLLVDGYTANLPWEMLQAGDEPMVIKTAMVRQLASARFRQKVRATTGKSACVIVDPSTEGYLKAFGKPGDKPLPRLPGAVEEGRAVRELLDSNNYQVEFVPPESEAIDVLARLFRNPYRILMVAAHGVFQATAKDGTQRTGVVLSGGVLLTAVEVGQLEVVPEVVFLNCCHLGKVDETPLPRNVNRLAYSLARELIEMGVRCVVVAGWAVNDQAARTFADTFFRELVDKGNRFGAAVHAARRATYESHRDSNTWGAYQAYGDPAFVLEPPQDKSSTTAAAPVAPEELLARFSRLRDDAKHGVLSSFEAAQERVRDLSRAAPPDWIDLPQVQAAVGELYGEFGQEGFDAARAAYLRAIAEEDKAGRVPVRAIEQLANLEARTAARLCEKADRSNERRLKECLQEEALPMVDRAISRLEHLMQITAEPDDSKTPAGVGRVARPNLERWSILGSAFKTKATLLAAAGRTRSTVTAALVSARDAYKAAEGVPDDAEFNPYAMLNRLQLDALLEPKKTADVAALLAEQCKTAARRRFKSSYDFWDAVMVADAELTIRLAAGTIADADSEAIVVRTYKEAADKVPKSARQLDSVVKQQRLLASFLRSRGDAAQAEALERIAASLDPTGGPVVNDAASNAPKKRSPAPRSPRARKGGGKPTKKGRS